MAPVLSHTLHVYLWSVWLLWIGALQAYEAAIYYVIVSYTTLGYGDFTLGPDFRILGAMSAVTGIIMFALTTACRVALPARLEGNR